MLFLRASGNKAKWSQAMSSTSRTKDKARQGKPRHEGQGQTSRGNLHQSDSDWGEFLLKFDLGLHVASLVMSTPLFVKLFMCGEGGAQVSGLYLQGPLQSSHLRRALFQHDDQDKRSRSKAKDKPGQDKHKQRPGHKQNQGQGKAR